MWIHSSQLTQYERIFCIASVLTSLDRVANTSCIYGAFLKTFKPSALKPLHIQPIHTRSQCEHVSDVFNERAEDLVLDRMYDIVYMDPPYNHRQYAANYAPLNVAARYDDTIEVYGKAGLITDYNKSDFCSKLRALSALKTLLDRLKTSSTHWVLSYNNEGIIAFESLKQLLMTYGRVVLYSGTYKRFQSSIKSLKHTVKEYVWIIFVHQESLFEERDFLI
jgi:adenine-specific DNA-methyltransferase